MKAIKTLNDWLKASSEDSLFTIDGHKYDCWDVEEILQATGQAYETAISVLNRENIEDALTDRS